MRKKENKIILSTCLVIGFIVLISLIMAGVELYNNYLNKDQENLYIVIKQYEVLDGNIVDTSKFEVVFEAKFTDELYYHEKIETKYGYNEVLIEKGIAKVVDADCPHPYSLNGCMSNIITNDKNFLDHGIIYCMQHGISLSWEVKEK